MIAGEDHRFGDHAALPAVAVVNLLFPLFDEHEVAEYVEEAVSLQSLLPKVGRPVASRVCWIAGAAPGFPGMAASVEGQKPCLVPRQPRGHVQLVRIGGEVHERPSLELEERRARIAALLVLPLGAPPVLAGV